MQIVVISLAVALVGGGAKEPEGGCRGPTRWDEEAGACVDPDLASKEKLLQVLETPPDWERFNKDNANT